MATPALAQAPALPPPTPPDDASEEELEFEATAEVEAPPREVTRRSVGNATIRRVPGTRGDALRAIELMPGVARTSLGQGDPILRGAGAGESQTYLDGVPVPFLFHFGGLTSFMSSRLVEKLEVYPGNFSVRYGRSVGGVVEVTAKEPATDKLHAALELNLIDSAAYVEAPVTRQLAVAAAVRRSNIDLVFENFVPEDAYSVVAAPTYLDYQAIASYRLSQNTQLRLLSYGSRDSLELFFSKPSAEDPGLSGEIKGSIEFHRVGLELASRPAGGASASANLTVGRLDMTQRLGELAQTFGVNELHGRGEASFELQPNVRLSGGFDFFGWLLAGSYRGPQPGSEEGNPRQADPLAGQRRITVVDDSIPILRPAAYLELGWRPVSSLLVTPGVRMDYFGEIGEPSLDPRLAARWDVGSATALKWGVGYYSQAPQYYQSLPVIGNPELVPYRALQASAGVEQELAEQVKLSAEGFYKRIADVVVGTENRAAPHFINAGQGRIFGAEFSGEARWRQDGFAYLAYTLSRSERREEAGAWRLFDADQTHVLSLVASQGLGRGWDVGLRFRVVSGNPATPLTGATYDARTGVYVPNHGATNSERQPTFHQLDARVEKAWKIGPASVAVYLEVQNAYMAENAEGYRYSFDYSKREAVSGLGLFPNLGLRGEL